VGEGIRKIIDEDSIQELWASFAKHGFLQPVLVQPRQGHYELLIGARRLMAAKQAGLETIPALVLGEALKPEETIEAQLFHHAQSMLKTLNKLLINNLPIHKTRRRSS
jgi:ParB family chromosome partitioning protein